MGEMRLRSGAGLPDALVADSAAKVTSAVFRVLVTRMGSCLIVSSACLKNANAKVERSNGAISDTLRAYAPQGAGPRRPPQALLRAGRASPAPGPTLGRRASMRRSLSSTAR